MNSLLNWTPLRLAPLVLVLLVALAAAACSKEPPPVTVVSAPPVTPALPAECEAPDPAWTEVPDADIKRSTAARIWRANAQAFRTIKGLRRVCRAGLRAQFPATASSGGE
jgi:hypothetical protein